MSSFHERKSATIAAMNIAAADKSPKGSIDAPIIPILSAINSRTCYFTTSSCSGRISIFTHPRESIHIQSRKKARGGTWLFVSHDFVEDPASVTALLFEKPIPENSAIVFRFEPLIIAVECETLEAAQLLVSVALGCGFRESGVTGLGKRVMVAVRCAIRMEVPLGDEGRVLVSREYVEYLVKIANEKMSENRKRCELLLGKLVDGGFGCNGVEKVGFLVSDVSEEESKFENVDGHGPPGNDDKDGDSGSHEDYGINMSFLEPAGEPIERLYLWGHSSCTFNHTKILIFGGFGGIGRHARRNDLLFLDVETGTLETIAVVDAPSPRLGHTASVVGDDMYVVAGRADPTNILNEVWVFNVEKKQWKHLQCSGMFPPRHRHAAAVVGSKIYVYGGILDSTVLSSLHVLDVDTFEWSEIEVRGDQPGPRHSHSMVASGSKLYLFGGSSGDKALGDMYSFDINMALWCKVKTSGQSPNARFSHLMFSYLTFLGVLGGCPVTGHQDLFLFDIRSGSWKNTVVKSNEKLLFIRSTVNLVGNDVIIIGGGAACYAFGTKFSEPVKIDLLQLATSSDVMESTGVREKTMDCEIERENDSSLPCQDRIVDKVNGCAKHGSVNGEIRIINKNSALLIPYVLRVEKKFAKLVKDVLKNFGWLDLERKVYSQEDGVHIYLPVTGKLCMLLEDMKDLGDSFKPSNDIVSLKSSVWKTKLKDMSTSEALDLITSCGATKIVDEVIKVKKTPNSPFKVMKEVVESLLSRHSLPLELIEELPSRWERLGDIVVLPVTSFKDQLWETIEDLWPVVAKALGTQRLARQGRIAQTGTRDSQLEILVGGNGWVEHRESGILYSFDAAKCMFSWGNLSEKLRMGSLDCRGQVVVDLFAGIGYFVLPFLLRANAKMVYACEWNPNAIEALRRNVQANSVADRCIVLEGDNRVTAPKGVADRVCLGLLPSSECSWATAIRALREDGGVLHIHENVKDTEEGSWSNHVIRSISEIAKSEGRLWDVSIEHVERVKWYAPHIRHLVADVRCCRSHRSSS